MIGRFKTSGRGARMPALVTRGASAERARLICGLFCAALVGAPAVLLASAVGDSSAVAGAATTGYSPGAAEQADRAEKLPPKLTDVGITEHRDAQVPLDLTFRDEDGKEVRLGSYFDGRRPVILNPVYYGCPMLCGLVMNGLADAIKQMPWKPGDQYTVVTFSIDPRETPTLARLKKENYVKQVGDPAVAAGWHFLTGREPEIVAATGAVGFGYRWDEETQQFAHATAIIVCTPDGRVSRYLYGVEFPPKTLRLSLVEASEGKIGSPLDQITLFCFHYDQQEGRYALAAANVMKAGGLLTLAVLAAILVFFWRRERRRRLGT